MRDNPITVNMRKTACPKGHPYDHVDKWGRRRCHQCKRLRSRADYAKRSAEILAAQKRNGHTRGKPDPAKRRARWVLQTAVKDGRIVKPSTCGECRKHTPPHRLHGHHADYSKPLEVEWLCSTCHGLTFRKATA